MTVREEFIPKKAGFTITMPHEFLEQSYAIRGELHAQHGITFDTGASREGLDWFIDFSLRSNDDVDEQEAISIIKKKLVSYKVVFEVTIDSPIEGD
jgi:hypothetical protein